MSILSTILSDVRHALADARGESDREGSPGSVHRRRSSAFVRHLAGRYDKAHQAEHDVAVLSRQCADHRKRFGLNELLFDILVCRTREVPSATRRQKLTVITQAILAVESELAEDSREAVRDFNKLVLCSADYKLFIGSQTSNRRSLLAPLGEVASHCTGHVYAVLVPHPARWQHGDARLEDVVGYRWTATNWVEIE